MAIVITSTFVSRSRPEQTTSDAETATARRSGPTSDLTHMRRCVAQPSGASLGHPAKEGHKMTTPGEVQTGAREKATAADRDELFGARLFVSDVEGAVSAMRVALLLTDEAYGRAVARVFGIPKGKQTVLVKLIVTSALATVVGGYAPRLPRIRRPSAADTASGGAVLNTALRAIAGAPSQHMPAAGALIGLALLGHGIRRGIGSTATRTSREVHTAVHGAETRYGHHHPSASVAAGRTAR